jgi:hypothetical protein
MLNKTKRPRMDKESVTSHAYYACCPITVENRDYHHLSQTEIGGGKRISRYLSGAVPVEAQVTTVTAASSTPLWLPSGLDVGVGVFPQRKKIFVGGQRLWHEIP